jgi:ABC-type nitrate/sulfonate/bicarbonate transport system permease component
MSLNIVAAETRTANSSRIVARAPTRSGAPDRAFERGLGIVTPLAVLLLWEVAARAGWIDLRFFPAPSAVLAESWRLLRTGELIAHLGASLSRVAVGFVAGAIPAVVVGLAMGLNRYVRAALQPMIDATYPIPKIAILPLVLLIFGLGESGKYAILAIGVFFQVVITTAAGVAAIDRVYFDVARTFNVGRIALARTVVLPGAMPVIFAGMRLGLGTALLLVIAAEMVAAKSGLGFLIWQSWQIFAVEEMYVGLMTISLTGLVVFQGLSAIERRVLRWRPKNAG